MVKCFGVLCEFLDDFGGFLVVYYGQRYNSGIGIGIGIDKSLICIMVESMTSPIVVTIRYRFTNERILQ